MKEKGTYQEKDEEVDLIVSLREDTYSFFLEHEIGKMTTHSNI